MSVRLQPNHAHQPLEEFLQAEQILGLRPKLKADSVFLPIDDGVLLRNRATSFFLRGASVYEWIAKLAPHLTGQRTLADLCEGLDTQRIEMVARVVTVLLERGILKDHPVETVALPASVARHFHQQIEFIDEQSDAPLTRFKRFRDSAILLRGDGAALRAVTLALLRNGAGRISACAPNASWSPGRAIEQELDDLRHEGLDVALELNTSSLGPVEEELRQFDAVGYCSENPSLRAVYELNQQCLEARTSFIAGIVVGDESIVGPLANANGTCCWCCAALRLGNRLPPEHAAAFWRAVLFDEMPGFGNERFGPGAALLGNTLGFELFKLISGCRLPESQGHALLQSLNTLETRKVHVMAHPTCPHCSKQDSTSAERELLDVVAGSLDQNIGVEELMARCDQLVGDAWQPFAGFHDAEDVQLPLRTSAVSYTAAANHMHGPRMVRAFAEDTTITARRDAVLRALELYCDDGVDERRATWASATELEGRRAALILPEKLASWSGGATLDSNDRVAWVPACSLLTGALTLVPLAAAYPKSRHNARGLFRQTQSGIAAGHAFQSVVAKGILSAFADERLCEYARKRVDLVDLDALSERLTSTAASYLLRVAQRIGTVFRLVALRGADPVHVVLSVDAAGEAGACVLGVGFHVAEAIRCALLERVGIAQMPGSSAPVAQGLVLPPGFSLSPGWEGLPCDPALVDKDPGSAEGCISYLREVGRDAFFVDTTPSDVRSTKTFLCGRVLLTRGNR